MNFETLLNTYTINIPVIQRAYVQGNEAQGELFINAIFAALRYNQTLDLDFIYGPIRNNELIPIDGQQRLTTLFLLHWYIWSKESSQNQWVTYQTLLERFSYTNRGAATDFCSELANYYIDPNSIHNQSLQTVLREADWFRANNQFLMDPTVLAMLNMLDKIHSLYSGPAPTENLSQNLKNITFECLNLENYTEPDQLYIKMNARGKQLSSFENFKAHLVEYIRQSNLPSIDGQTADVFWGLKLDVDWLDFFWKLDEKNSLDDVDHKFLCFFRRYLLNAFIKRNKDGDLNNKQIGKEEQYQYFIKETRYFDFKPYKLEFDQPGLLDELKDFLDKLKANWSDINEAVKPTWNNKAAWNPFQDKINQRDRIVFYGLSLYLNRMGNFDKSHFSEWMRVVWNITENTDINSAESMIGCMYLIDNISQGCTDIYNFLSTSEYEGQNAALKEEILKATFIKADKEWEDLFKDAEADSFLRGGIGFMIHPKGVSAEFDHTIEKKHFENRTSNLHLIFDQDGFRADRCIGHILLRAILSRYDSIPLSTRNTHIRFNDKKESQTYLKKRLTSDYVFKSALYELLNEPNSTSLKKKITRWSNDFGLLNTNADIKEQNAFEILITESALWDSLLSNNRKDKFICIYKDNSTGHYFVSNNATESSYKVLISSNRNDVIGELLAVPYNAELVEGKQLSIGAGNIPFFESRGVITLAYNNYLIKFQDSDVKGEVEIWQEQTEIKNIDGTDAAEIAAEIAAL